MPVSFNKFRQFSEDLGKAVHNFTSDGTCSLKLALCAAANAPVNTNEVLANLTEIDYTNLSTRQLTGVTFEQSAGVATLTVNDLTLSASGGAVATFRYVVLYNDTPSSPADPLIGYWDYGGNVTLNDGESLLVDFISGAITLS